MEYQADFFEDVRQKVGCPHISDLKIDSARIRAVLAIRDMELTAYPLFALQDMADYLFDEKVTFADHAEAHRYFTDHE